MNAFGISPRIRSTTRPTYADERASVLNDLVRSMPFDQFTDALLAVLRDMPDLTDGEIETLSHRIGRLPSERIRQ